MKDKPLKSHQGLLIISRFFIIGLVGFIFSVKFDVFKKFSNSVKKFERYNFDEIVIVIFFWFLYLLVAFIFKHNKEQKQKQKLAELSSKLQKNLDEKEKLYSIIGHDLISPFNLLIGFSDILLKKNNKIDSNKQKEMILIINNTAKSTMALLYNLLDWARLGTNGILFNRKEINMSTVVEKAISYLQMVAHNKNISLNNRIPNTTTAYANENMVATVIRNLVSNAIKFSYNNSSVNIILRNLKNFVEITISDSGVGLTQEQLKALFSTVSTPTTGTNKEKGTGLGIKICKDFIERNMGELKVRSVAGKGADFIFTLPNKKMNNH